MSWTFQTGSLSQVEISTPSMLHSMSCPCWQTTRNIDQKWTEGFILTSIWSRLHLQVLLLPQKIHLCQWLLEHLSQQPQQIVGKPVCQPPGSAELVCEACRMGRCRTLLCPSSPLAIFLSATARLSSHHLPPSHHPPSTCWEKKKQQELPLTVLERTITEMMTVDGDDELTGKKKQTLSHMFSVEHWKVIECWTDAEADWWTERCFMNQE